MTLIAFWDIESDGLLEAKLERNGTWSAPMSKVHTITIIFQKGDQERRISAADKPGYEFGAAERGWERMGLVDALKLLEQADLRVGHNSQSFDERAIRKIYPWFNPKEGSSVADTMIMSKAIYPDIHRTGPNTHKLMGFLKRSHSLKAWGLRLGEHKGDYTGGWMEWSDEMQAYGEQDTVVLVKLFRWLMAQKPAAAMLNLEHAFSQVILRQEARGVCFDYDKALTLLAALTAREQELEATIIEAFGSWWRYGKPANSKAEKGANWDENEDDEDADDPVEQERRRKLWLMRQEYGEVIIPTASRKVKMLGFPDVTIQRFSDKTGKEVKPYIGPPLIDYTQGHAYTPIERVQFKPSSRTHIRQRLVAKYGWEPVKFTKPPKGGPPSPVVDDDVLMSLPYPEAKLLAEYYLVLKRIGMLATGKKAWLKVARETKLANGQSVWRIHGRVNTNGAATGRCTHSDPNMAQVPKNSAAVKQYPDQWYLHGSACRDLFIPGPGYTLVGFDGSSLELRMLAHRVFPWDHGAYAKAVDEGVKEERTDPHSALCLMIGEDLLGPVTGSGRDNAKTVMYADLYGAGDEKRGSIVLPHGSKSEKQALGRKIGEAMSEGFAALTELKGAITEDVENRRPLKGLDGRTLNVRKAHAALNTQLQSDGAVAMKKSLVILDRDLQAAGLVPGIDYEFVLNVHDEAQAEVLPTQVTLYQSLAVHAVEEAGRLLGLKCPLKAEAVAGRSWQHTH